MQPAAGATEFLQSPTGRYVSGETWLAFCAPDPLAGLLLWGRPNEEDTRAFIRLIPVCGSPLAARQPRLFDVRRMEGPEPAAFAIFADYVTSNAGLLKEAVTRLAIVHTAGMSGAIAAGFTSVAPTPYPVDLFTEIEAALAWLGCTNPTALATELDDLHAKACGQTPLLRDLRALLEARLRDDMTLLHVAGTLGLSARSLQRRLREQRTSFQQQLSAARVEKAQRLLLETEATVSEVAFAVGCASTHHFGALFRRMTGAAPTEWRAIRRAEKPDATE
jgi:AraC-like DNA-binding protein